MKRVVRVVREDSPGPKWQSLYEHVSPAYERWFLREGDHARPSYAACRRAMHKQLPKLEPLWDDLVELAGGGDRAARMLSLYRPTPYMTGCSQLAWTRGEPVLIRNYDYRPDLWEATVWISRWNGLRTAVMGDSMWGALDGVNEAGLAVSLTFGGRRVVGDGFAVTLLLRYLLEFCETVPQAEEVIRRFPAHMAYNVTVIDAAARSLTAFLSPKGPQIRPDVMVCTNHQETIDWREYVEATASLKRESFLAARLRNPTVTSNELLVDFLQQPLFSRDYRRAHGTLYTAVYRPLRRDALFVWPHHVLHVPLFGDAEPMVEIDYSAFQVPLPATGWGVNPVGEQQTLWSY